MKPRIVTIVLVLFISGCLCFGAEPGTNVGKTLTSLRKEFPSLRFIKTDTQGDHYHDGEDPTEGVNCIFILRNDCVIEECVMVQDTNGFPLQWWRQVCDKFYFGTSYQKVVPKPGHYKFFYSYFTIDHIFIEDGQQKTAMTVYKLK